jgi:hypothetical protein
MAILPALILSSSLKQGILDSLALGSSDCHFLYQPMMQAWVNNI